jgi:putative heme iron utilization protein
MPHATKMSQQNPSKNWRKEKPNGTTEIIAACLLATHRQIIDFLPLRHPPTPRLRRAMLRAQRMHQVIF